MSGLPKKYNHKESEKKWQQYWRDNKIYKWEKDLSRNQTFVIDTPPPTVSGLLHMGHIFSYVQADFVARYQRMSGKTVFYPMGFDDNGLPTERLVEKVKGIRGVDMNRAEFVKECYDVVEEAEAEFEELFNSIALSVDWDEKYQTISDKSQKISQLSFIDLFNKGLVERKMEPVLWDISDRTALSQADLVDKEKPSAMNDIIFEIEGGGQIVIATTRPELLPACVAVMVHPDDERYKDLVGKKAITALFGVKVKIIADELVQMDKGTGAVMCCTFGDETDILWWKNHGLELRIIMGEDGRMKESFYNSELGGDDGKGKVLFFGRHGSVKSSECLSLDNLKIKYDSLISGKKIKEARALVLEELKNTSISSDLRVFDPSLNQQAGSTLPQGEGDSPGDNSFSIAKKEGDFVLNNSPLEGESESAKRDLVGGQNSLKATRFYSQETLLRAKELRNNNSNAEALLWYYLKNKQLNDFKFRRQQPIDKYIVDFVCLESKLVVELDGSQHGIGENIKYDEGRTKFLESLGYKVIRFWNNDIFDNIGDVLESILKELNFDDKIKKSSVLIKSTPITHSVKCAERSGCPIEIIVAPQWFIKIVDFKEQLKEKAKQCNWYPQFMRIRIEQWIDGASWDWCISRQRFFGVPFPVWYSKREGEEGKILVADLEQLPCDPLKALPKGYKADEVVAETDIMDTWATSSVSPQLSSHGINQELTAQGDVDRHQKLFPADLRPQAHEIIRSWAFYTIVKALHHENIIPWKNLMISGWCLASDKTKMSKSKGNVITPNSLIEEKGSDIVRYWASTSHLGADTAYSEDVLKIGNKLLNKLFNAAKFASSNFDLIKNKSETVKKDVDSGIINQILDLWALSRLHQTIKKATDQFEKFEYAKAREVIEDFFWNDFCDNYLEIVKVRSYGLQAQKYENIDLSEEDKNKILSDQQSAITTLYHCLESLLRLFAPFTPHICEELYQAIFSDRFEDLVSIHKRGNWPNKDEYIFEGGVIEIGEVALQIISNIRKFKSDNNLSMKTPLRSFLINTKVDISDILDDLKNVCNSKEILIGNGSDLVEKVIVSQP